jgi:hypothetical protein
VLRLSKAYQEQGATALISKKRGRASNRQTPTDIKAQALELIKARYADFGPTLAAEKLREVHGITVGRETLRLWMLDAGLWAVRISRQRGRRFQGIVGSDFAGWWAVISRHRGRPGMGA